MKIRKILICIDESEYSQHAAEYGFDIAQTYGTEVGLVHIIEPMTPVADTTDTLTGLPFDATLESTISLEVGNIQTERSAVILERARLAFGGGLEVSKFTEYGATADGIIECAINFNADLIVMGTHRRTGIDRWFLGNVAEDVIKNSEIPVLVVPFKK
ncbi:universal stress protein [Mucilaginibacter celer]|uniref:Universal stress protein n=1 Tax=Mucilaginibacter celer TaxID=2305508 RepID=A0A494VPP8_9SPHI|nr:universal stress protein [Mucilaginibacter celer]AYL97437.1 universal stress protein [Mucilaginibacter celer]